MQNMINVERVKHFLVDHFHYNPNDCGSILEMVRRHARVTGFDVDDRFGAAGLSSGPESRAASRLVGLALGIRGNETSEDSLKKELDYWLQHSWQLGR